MKNYRLLIRSFVLIAFIYLMLCPYASILSDGFTHKILIHEHDFIRKTKKVIKNDFHPLQLPVLLKTPAGMVIPASGDENLPVCWSFHQCIGLNITTTVQLLL